MVGYKTKIVQKISEKKNGEKLRKKMRQYKNEDYSEKLTEYKKNFVLQFSCPR